MVLCHGIKNVIKFAWISAKAAGARELIPIATTAMTCIAFWRHFSELSLSCDAPQCCERVIGKLHEDFTGGNIYLQSTSGNIYLLYPLRNPCQVSKHKDGLLYFPCTLWIWYDHHPLSCNASGSSSGEVQHHWNNCPCTRTPMTDERHTWASPFLRLSEAAQMDLLQDWEGDRNEIRLCTKHFCLHSITFADWRIWLWPVSSLLTSNDGRWTIRHGSGCLHVTGLICCKSANRVRRVCTTGSGSPDEANSSSYSGWRKAKLYSIIESLSQRRCPACRQLGWSW